MIYENPHICSQILSSSPRYTAGKLDIGLVYFIEG